MKSFAVGLFAATIFFVMSSHAAVQTKEITYSADGTTLKGFLAWDGTISGPRPGILVVHEWWGLNDYARSRAEQLAKLGYTAFAVDMYGNGRTAAHPKDAQALMADVAHSPETVLARFQAALDVLKKQSTVNPDKIGAIGYCFGGAVVLNAVRSGIDLDAVASFHGALAGLIPVKGPIKAKILVCTGADDPLVTPDQVEAFKEQMKGSHYEVISYPGARHGFTNPKSDENREKYDLQFLAYNPEADTKSWEAMKGLFKKVF